MLSKTKQTITKLLIELSKEQLIEFITEYAERDADFFNAINVRFGVPEFDEELSKISHKIDYALDGVSNWDNRDSWGYVHVDTSDIVDEICERAEQGHVRLAFGEIELLYRKLLKNFEYQGECEISDEAEDCLRIMSEIADKALQPDDKEFIFRQCLELAELEDGKDYGADYEDKLLLIAAKFVTQENIADLEAVLDLFEADTWRAEPFKLIRLEIIRHLQGTNSAKRFIAENLSYPKIREIAYDTAMSNNDFEKGEQLCSEALINSDNRYGISPWLYKLFNVHESMGDKKKMSGTAKKILLQGDIKFYSTLKSLLQSQAVWEDSYPKLLDECSVKLHYSQYMEILEKENEYPLLLAQLEQHTDKIYRYGKFLAEKYPQEILSIFVLQLEKEAEVAYGREAYSKVCANIMKFASAGYNKESRNMTEQFKLKYKRKPAFLDELQKVYSSV